MGLVHWRQRGLERRMRRSFGYSNGRSLDQLSLPLTEAVVEYFTKHAPFDDLNLQYASDVGHNGAVSPSVLIVAMIYLERMRLNKKDQFESSDPADLFTSALLCATKFLYDEAEAEFVYNDEWAHSCSRTLAHVNRNEVEFLKALDWNIMAREKEFYGMLRKLQMTVARKEWRWRGFPTYSDLSVLASCLTQTFNEAIVSALAVIGLATLTYTATIFGLYTCSLYASTTTTVRIPPISVSRVVDSPRSGSLPSPVLLSPSSVEPVLSVVFEPFASSSSNHVETSPSNNNTEQRAPFEEAPATSSSDSTALIENAPIEREEPSRISSSPPSRSGSIRNQNNNGSFCGIEAMSGGIGAGIDLPSPWASWIQSTKSAFAVWTV